jgi:5-methylcytosine-specific restriction endonuclease McrBC GTP-binding regulatory subunit McrB
MPDETSTTPTHATPIQCILFGSSGTGKSHRVQNTIVKDLSVSEPIKTIFHPEYTHGDFMGKLMPLTDEHGKVSYRYYLGHFMKALAQAYKLYLEAPTSPKNVLLVIDEINRGNSAAIFGTAFQLLDRDDDGWSSYAIHISDMERDALLSKMGAVPIRKGNEPPSWTLNDKKIEITREKETINLANGEIKLPPNLSIVGTMNTSDESIYYMDSAFKRRWSWEYVGVKAQNGVTELANATLKNGEVSLSWVDFVNKLNQFIVSHHQSIRKVEDKQIGYYFIKAKDGKIQSTDIQNKLMFFLWDTVFARDKEPLETLLGSKGAPVKLVTFGDFNQKWSEFITAIDANKHV